jgi:phosphocarrier protein
MEETIEGESIGLSRQVLVLNELGLHARPAAKLAQEAQKFSSDIKLVSKDQEVDAKSILDILTLSAGKGSGLTIKAEGDDAEQAVVRLSRLFESRFDEAR